MLKNVFKPYQFQPFYLYRLLFERGEKMDEVKIEMNYKNILYCYENDIIIFFSLFFRSNVATKGNSTPEVCTLKR